MVHPIQHRILKAVQEPKEGGKTGLNRSNSSSIVCGMFIFCALALKHSAFLQRQSLLIFIATYFLRNIADIYWEDVTEYAPAVLAAVLMPDSIAHGIALGFIAYAVIKAPVVSLTNLTQVVLLSCSKCGILCSGVMGTLIPNQSLIYERAQRCCVRSF